MGLPDNPPPNLNRTERLFSNAALFPRSGLSHESHRRDVEQVYLRCSQGSLEWLYPTGAIVVNLRPNTAPTAAHRAGLHVCVKPYPYSQVEAKARSAFPPGERRGVTGLPELLGSSNWVCPPVFRALRCTWSALAS